MHYGRQGFPSKSDRRSPASTSHRTDEEFMLVGHVEQHVVMSSFLQVGTSDNQYGIKKLFD